MAGLDGRDGITGFGTLWIAAQGGNFPIRGFQWDFLVVTILAA